MLQEFEAERTRRLVGGRLLLRGHCLDVGEPPPQLTDEVDDLPACLVADASHQVDIADRVLQQVADGQDIRPLQAVAGTGAQAQGGDRRIQFRLFQADPEIDLLAAGGLDLPLFRLLEDLLPGPTHLVCVVEPLGRLTMQRLAEEL